MSKPQGIPTTLPLIDPQTGSLALSWLQFFIALWNRTGSATGNDLVTSFNFPSNKGDVGQALISQGSDKPSLWKTLDSKLSQFANDVGFITANAIAGFQNQAQVSSLINTSVANQTSNDLPRPDTNLGFAGFSTTFSRSDHEHPREVSPNFVGSLQAASVTAQKYTNAHNVTWTTGSGAPSGVQPNSSLYSRTDGGTGARLYVSNGTTWLPVTGV